jgi:hypothetical protein
VAARGGRRDVGAGRGRRDGRRHRL